MGFAAKMSLILNSSATDINKNNETLSLDLIAVAIRSIRGSKAHFATLHCYPELQHNH
jgi:hypothetical protein